MTDEIQNQTYLATLRQTEAGLLAGLNRINAPPSDADGDDPPDRSPRNISATLKAIEDVRSQIKTVKADEQSKKYTRWEDLPPPSPEDEARYYEQFKRIFDYVVEADAQGLDLSLDADAPPAMARSRLARSRSSRPDATD